MRESIKMVAVLSIICAVAGFALSYLKNTTAPIIEAQVLTYVQGPAIARIFPAAENNPIADRHVFELEGRELTVFPYKQGGKLVGVALENSAPGYGGDLGVMVGFSVQRDALLGIGVTEMKETPGLGALVAEPKFSGQFTGKPFDVQLTSQGGTIDAVSGATISSVGTVTAVGKAVKDYQAVKDQILKTWQ